MAKKKPAATTEEIKDHLMGKTEKEIISLASNRLLSTGSTCLNLALSGKIVGGIPKGTYIHYCGDSDSGKTFFGMTIFAEAARNENFDDYDFHFWNAEGGALMDRIHFFGKKASERIIEHEPEVLEDFYYSVDDRIHTAEKEGRPFLGLLDSMDTLVPKAWIKKFKKNKAAAAREAEESGDFGMQKAKINSENLRRLRTKLSRTGSILIIISQVRDNAQSGGYGDKKSVSGGRVLKFFAAAQIWTSTRETLKKSVLGQPRAIGIKSQVDIKKNHINGNKGRVYIPILNDSGMDDVGSCVDFLTFEKYWKSTSSEDGKGKITAPEFADPGKKKGTEWEPMSREKLIRRIETANREPELRKLVKKVWQEIQEGCKSHRKPRYE